MRELFRISKEQLNIVVNTINNIASEKSPDIYHSSLKIKLKDNKLQFICRNFEAYFCREYDYALQDEELAFVVGVDIFSNLIRKLESEEICFFQQGEKLVIVDKKSKFELDTIRGQYPEREISNFQFLCSINSKHFSEKIQLCLLKLDNGIFSFSFGKDSYFVARDNRKLAITKLEQQTIEEISINLSDNIIVEIKETFSLYDNIEIHYSEKEILFKSKDYFLICKNHWARSINYLELCKSDTFTEIKFNTSDFKKTLRKLKLMASSLTNAMDMQFFENMIRVSVFNPSVGNAQEEISIEHQVANMKIKLNIVHFINILQLIKGESFSFLILDPKNKVVIKDEATYLLMPLSF